MKFYVVLATLILSASILQAQVLGFDHGKIEFSTTNIMSDIEAVSNTMEVSLDTESGEVEILIPINSFEFEYEMMQEHFNEEYLESDLFPNARFVGKISDDISNLQAAIEVKVAGELSIHGVSKTTSFTASLSKKDGLTKVKCLFPIIFKDFNVEEPSILSKAIARDVELKAVLYLR